MLKCEIIILGGTVSNQNKRQMNKNEMNTNYSDGTTETCESIGKKEMEVNADSANFRLDKVFHPDSEVIFKLTDSRFYNREQRAAWHKTIQEVDALFDSEKRIV